MATLIGLELPWARSQSPPTGKPRHVLFHPQQGANVRVLASLVLCRGFPGLVWLVPFHRLGWCAFPPSRLLRSCVSLWRENSKGNNLPQQQHLRRPCIAKKTCRHPFGRGAASKIALHFLALARISHSKGITLFFIRRSTLSEGSALARCSERSISGSEGGCWCLLNAGFGLE